MKFHLLFTLSLIFAVSFASGADELLASGNETQSIEDQPIQANLPETTVENGTREARINATEQRLIESLQNITERLQRVEWKRGDAMRELKRLIRKSNSKLKQTSQENDSVVEDEQEDLKRVSIPPGLYYIRLSSPKWYLKPSSLSSSSYIDKDTTFPSLKNLFNVFENANRQIVFQSVMDKMTFSVYCDKTTSSSYSSSNNPVSMDTLEHPHFAGRNSRFELYTTTNNQQASADAVNNNTSSGSNSTPIRAFLYSISSGEFVRVSQSHNLYADVDSDRVTDAMEFVFEPLAMHLNRMQQMLPAGRYNIRVDCPGSYYSKIKLKECYLAEDKEGELILKVGKWAKTSFNVTYNNTDGSVSLSSSQGSSGRKMLRASYKTSTYDSYDYSGYSGNSYKLSFERCKVGLPSTKFELIFDDVEAFDCGEDVGKATALLRETVNWKYLRMDSWCPACVSKKVELRSSGSKLYFERVN